jgi:hypothetical protein
MSMHGTHTDPHHRRTCETEWLMNSLMEILKNFAELGQLEAAGPHIHELIGIAYAAAGPQGKAVSLGPVLEKRMHQ